MKKTVLIFWGFKHLGLEALKRHDQAAGTLG